MRKPEKTKPRSLRRTKPLIGQNIPWEKELRQKEKRAGLESGLLVRKTGDGCEKSFNRCHPCDPWFSLSPQKPGTVAKKRRSPAPNEADRPRRTKPIG